jgi:hypothetical protein
MGRSERHVFRENGRGHLVSEVRKPWRVLSRKQYNLVTIVK